MDRLRRLHHDEADRASVELQVFIRSENNIGAKLKKADAVVLFTNKLSHRVKNEAILTFGNGYQLYCICSLKSHHHHKPQNTAPQPSP